MKCWFFKLADYFHVLGIFILVSRDEIVNVCEHAVLGWSKDIIGIYWDLIGLF
jgi:hypothetical protein